MRSSFPNRPPEKDPGAAVTRLVTIQTAWIVIGLDIAERVPIMAAAQAPERA
jgi:hypothetical protein